MIASNISGFSDHSFYEVEKQETVDNIIEITETPFESGFHVQSIPKRNSPAGKKLTARRRRNKIKVDEDPEIDALLRIYGDRVNVIK